MYWITLSWYLKRHILACKFVDSSHQFEMSLNFDTHIPNVLLSIFWKHYPHQVLDCFYSENVENWQIQKSNSKQNIFGSCQTKFRKNIKNNHSSINCWTVVNNQNGKEQTMYCLRVNLTFRGSKRSSLWDWSQVWNFWKNN